MSIYFCFKNLVSIYNGISIFAKYKDLWSESSNEKTDLNFLVTKMSNMTVDLNYTGAKVASFSLLTKELR